MRKSNKPRTGTVVVFVALSLTVLISFVALAVDGGILLDDRRRVQSVADSASLAAAEELYARWRTNGGLDLDGKAEAKAVAAASAGGFTDVTVRIPPTTGSFAGQPGYAEVIVNMNQQRFFSTIWSSDSVKVSARSVAQGRWAPFKTGILVLDPTSSGALTNSGGGTMTVAGVPAVINSNAADAATGTGNGTSIAPEFAVVGYPGISGSGSWLGTISPRSTPVPDPLKYLPEPDPTSMVVQSRNPTHISGQSTVTIDPGVYRGGIKVSGQGKVIMNPGIYYMDGGGFEFTGQGGMDALGVMIVNVPRNNSDTISINGIGSINFSPVTTGIYKGISLWQARSSSNTISVSGNGTSSMSGTFYTARGTLEVSGNGTNDVIGSQYISYKLGMGGNGSFTVNWSADETARTRMLNLVE